MREAEACRGRRLLAADIGLDQAAGCARLEQGLTISDSPDGVDQCGWLDPFEDALAPALSAPKTYSSRSNVVRTITFVPCSLG
jgi:hypothetical protein